MSSNFMVDTSHNNQEKFTKISARPSMASQSHGASRTTLLALFTSTLALFLDLVLPRIPVFFIVVVVI